MEIIEAQKDMRAGNLGGNSDVLVSGLVWLSANNELRNWMEKYGVNN